MHDVELFVALLAAILGLVWLSRPLRVAYPVVLVLGGLGLGLLPFLPDVTVDPEFVLFAFLPPILHRAAFQFSAEDTRMQWHAIALLAVGLVLVTIGAVAAVAHLVVGIPWDAAFVLGAILGPTDPVAATSVFRRLGVPDRLATMLEGESLVNDGSAITAFRIGVGVLGGEAFHAGPAVLEFAGVAAGGLALGAAIGYAGTLVRRRLGAVELEITAGLVMAYGAFALAERLHLSGILAVVAVGFVVGRAGAYTDPETRVQATAFWQALAFVAESALFVLVGTAFADALDDDVALGALAANALLIGATCIAVRLLWMSTVPYVAAHIDRRIVGSRPLTEPHERLLLGVTGMRGAVSIAAALAVPASADARADIVLLTCGAVLVTLVPVAVGLPALVRRLGLSQDEEARRRYVEARVQVAHAALRRAEELARERDAPESLLQRAREAYELRIARLQSTIGSGDEEHGDVAHEYKRLRHELLEAEREALDDLSGRHEVRGPALRRIRHELDLEETRLSR